MATKQLHIGSFKHQRRVMKSVLEVSIHVGSWKALLKEKNWRNRARQHPRRKHLTGAVTDAIDADALRRDDLLSDTDKLATCA